MSSKSNFTDALYREMHYYWLIRTDFLLSISILLISMMLVAQVFSSGTLIDLPIGVIDQDGSSISRQYVRMLEASPEIHIQQTLVSPTEARELIEQASIYAAVLIPKNFSKDIKTGRQVTIVAWHSGQFLTMSGALSKSLRKVTGTLSAGIEITSIRKRGDHAIAALVNFNPVQPEFRTLFNASVNYQYFLVAALLPAMLQVFVMVWSVYIVGREFDEPTNSQSLPKQFAEVIFAKVMPIFVVSSLIACSCLYWLYGYSGWPVIGSLSMLLLAWEIMICAYISLGIWVASLDLKLSTALSVTAAFTAPAFAYVGITFPQQAMPFLAQIWTYALPVRSLLKLQVEQAEMGAPMIYSLNELGILIAFAIVPLPFAIYGLRKRINLQSLRCN